MTILLGILTTIMVGWVLHVGAAVLQPLVIALLLASMLQPVVLGLRRFKIPPFVTVILLVTLIFFGLARVGFLLQKNVKAFLGDLPVPEEVAMTSPSERPTVPPQAAEPIDKTSAEERTNGGRDPEFVPVEGEEPPVLNRVAGEQQTPLDPISTENNDVTENAQNWDAIVTGVSDRMRESTIPGPLAEYLSKSLREVDLEGFAAGIIGGGFDFGKGLMLVVIYMLFIFAEQAVFRRKLLSISNDQSATADILDTIGKGIQRYLGVKTLVSFATGALCYAVLVALDIPFALLFGFLTFLLNYIPTFGSIIAGAFPAITALADGSSMNKVIIVVVTYLAVNITLGSLLEPRILGRELNLSPLVIIVSVVVWAALWGVIGTFLAVPLTAAMQIILASQDNTRPIAVMLSSGPAKDKPVLDISGPRRAG